MTLVGALLALGNPAVAVPNAAPPRSVITITGFDPLDPDNPGPAQCVFDIRGTRSYVGGSVNTTYYDAVAESTCVNTALRYVDVWASIGSGDPEYEACDSNSACGPVPNVSVDPTLECPGNCGSRNANGRHVVIAASLTFVWVGYDPAKCSLVAEFIPGVPVGDGSAIMCDTRMSLV